MKKFLHHLWLAHQNFWNKARVLTLVRSVLLLVLALVIQKLADVYVGNLKGVVVPDIILDHIPTLDIDPIIVQGALILTAVIAWLLIIKPKFAAFTIKALSIFIITRSFFISLTHLGISPRELVFDTNSWGFGVYNFLYNTKGDFFFSGHTGAPYLLALIFWNEKRWRYFFLAVSFIFALSVLFAHIHYSIDVFAAPFMTYGIYIISKTLFPKDLAEADAD